MNTVGDLCIGRPGSPWGITDDASAAQGAEDQQYPWSRGCAARRGRGAVGTPLPRLFFSHRERHTPLPAQAVPALPAPAAIISRAAGVQRSRALPWVSWHPRGQLAGWAGAGHPSSYSAASPGAQKWCWGNASSWGLPPWGHGEGQQWAAQVRLPRQS